MSFILFHCLLLSWCSPGCYDVRNHRRPQTILWKHLSQATSTPAHILEKTGVCIPMMEAGVVERIFHSSRMFQNYQHFFILFSQPPTFTVSFCCCNMLQQAAPSEKGPNYVMLSPCAGLLPAGHSFQRGDWLLVTFPPTATPGISITSRGDVSVEAEVVMITAPPGQGILVRMVGELGRNAGHVGPVRGKFWGFLEDWFEWIYVGWGKVLIFGGFDGRFCRFLMGHSLEDVKKMRAISMPPWCWCLSEGRLFMIRQRLNYP